jgi:hypothetical protein
LGEGEEHSLLPFFLDMKWLYRAGTIRAVVKWVAVADLITNLINNSHSIWIKALTSDVSQQLILQI